ncbi:MAG: SDR family oxidoreductase [Deltaproteobacteria bacterium]|nr:SDR family oxidoreductase [Deltaproteobacteria bacterium]
MKYLVTGGAGFIGSHIAERLVKEGERVRVLDNLDAGKMENLAPLGDRVEFIKGDIRSREDIKKAVQGIDYILHQAALRSVPKSMTRPIEYHEVNVTGTFNLLNEAKGAGVKKVVFASSSSIYGVTDKFPQKEGSEAMAVSPYALTKKLGEEYCQFYSSVFGLPTVCLRYFNVFGPRQSLDDDYAVVIPKFITFLLQGKRPPIYGDGTQSRDFTFIANVVDANLAALRSDVGRGEAINVACGDSHSVLSLAEQIAKLALVNGIKPEYLPPRPGDVPKTQADITRLRKLLGITPRISFQEGLRTTIQWFQTQKAA